MCAVVEVCDRDDSECVIVVKVSVCGYAGGEYDRVYGVRVCVCDRSDSNYVVVVMLSVGVWS